jgi:DNA-directed RNA polymerase subunit RPC12/RpoP
MAESTQPEARAKIHRYPCPGCGADLEYNPKGGVLTCPYCGREEIIPESAEQIQERSYEEYLKPRAGQLQQIARGALEVTCNSCGATVTFTPPEVAGECAFCGGKIVAQAKASDPLIAPESVLPFSITQAQATDAIKKWLASRWFAPNSLKRLAYHEAIKGVYLPFWTYDAHTRSYYTGERGEYYYVTEQYTERDAQGNTVTKTRQVRRTRWYPASGWVERWFDDLLVPAAKSISRPRLASLEPWDMDVLKPYDPAYLAGYKAQRYEVEMSEGFEEAKQVMAGVIEGDVRNDIGGDEQRISHVDTSYSAITFKHLLLPVYIAAYRFNQKIYQVMINARTGEVQGDRPYSIWKIALLVLFILAVIAVIAYFNRGG